MAAGEFGGIVIGTLIIYLWRGRLAGIGIIPICIAFILIPLKPMPDIIVAPQLDLVGIYNHEDTLYLNNTRKNGFARGIWMETLGLDDNNKAAKQKWPRERNTDIDFIACDTAACRMNVAGKRVSYVAQNAAKETECAWADIAIAYAPLYGCAASIRIDRGRTKRKGSYAVYIDGDDVRIETATGFTGARPWTQ